MGTLRYMSGLGSTSGRQSSVKSQTRGRFPDRDHTGRLFTAEYCPRRAKLAGSPLAGSYVGCWAELRGDWKFLKQVSDGRGVFRCNLQISSALLGQTCLDHLIWVHPSLGNVGSLFERALQQSRCDVSPLFGLQRYSGVGIVIIDLRGMATDGPAKLDPIGRENNLHNFFKK